jgi:hypothetical protein
VSLCLTGGAAVLFATAALIFGSLAGCLAHGDAYAPHGDVLQGCQQCMHNQKGSERAFVSAVDAARPGNFFVENCITCDYMNDSVLKKKLTIRKRPPYASATTGGSALLCILLKRSKNLQRRGFSSFG